MKNWFQAFALKFNLHRYNKVECKTGDGWAKGNIVNIMWRDDESMPSGMTVPYQIELADGTLIYAPFDDNEIIRADKSKSAPKRKKASA